MAASTTRASRARLAAAPMAYAAASAVAPRGEPNSTAPMAPRPGGVVTKTATNTSAAPRKGTSQLQVARNTGIRPVRSRDGCHTEGVPMRCARRLASRRAGRPTRPLVMMGVGVADPSQAQDDTHARRAGKLGQNTLESGAVDADEVLEGPLVAGDWTRGGLQVGWAEAVRGEMVRKIEPADQIRNGVSSARGGLLDWHLAQVDAEGSRDPRLSRGAARRQIAHDVRQQQARADAMRDGMPRPDALSQRVAEARGRRTR